MAILTPRQLTEREAPEQVLQLGGGDEVLVRRPDLQTLIYENILPTPLMSRVVKTIASWASVGSDTVTADMVARDENMREFVDTWVCAAMVQPRAVREPKPEPGEVPAPFSVPDDAVNVKTLTLETRVKVFSATFSFNTRQHKAAVEAAERFPDVGHGEGAGPDVPEVQPASV